MKKLNDMSDASRIWIYASNRMLTNEEVLLVQGKLNAFIDDWSSHGANMDASGEVMYQRFVVIAADETKAMASGCGIDKSVRFMQDLGKLLDIDFFKRTLTHFVVNEEIHQKELHEFWAMKKAGLIDDQTIVFDHTIKSLAELRNQWMIPFSASWHAEMWSR